MVRKDRSDITVDKIEDKHGLPKGIIRNENGRKARKNKTLKTIKKSEVGWIKRTPKSE
jgi:hypothetical protein